MANLIIFITYLILNSIYNAQGDTPANCTYEDIEGTWLFKEGPRIFSSDLNCNSSFETETPTKTVYLTLTFPNVAVDQLGNTGTWTVIYNQGFEVTINYRKYFSFSLYETHGKVITSYCHQTLPGWSHNVLGKNWGCFTGTRLGPARIKQTFLSSKFAGPRNDLLFRTDAAFINRINSDQDSWRARKYAYYENLTLTDLFHMKGGPKSYISSYPKLASVDLETQRIADSLPLAFDWRDVNGVNFVSPVRNQGKCGSCYAFSSVGMIEARLRVVSNNSIQVELSPQDIVSCSEYSQGCEGGFPYLIAGKYSQDFGLVSERCSPYHGKDEGCQPNKCPRSYTARYRYVGDFYGGCNEQLMKIQLVRNGPMSVSFEVYPDFMHYSGGVYHHTGLEGGFNPFGLTNHAVLLVGYGTDAESKENFWIVKNSWGNAFGEDGYFRIRRGSNECNIESIAVEAFPIP